MKIILEGTDGVGKTSTILGLKKYGITCADRSKDVISKYMLCNIDMKERAHKYYEYLKYNDVLVIFLINNDRDELMNRIYSREKISDFDSEAYEYNGLYLETYNYMKKHNLLNDKLILVDVTNLTLDEQIEKVKKVILKRIQYDKIEMEW